MTWISITSEGDKFEGRLSHGAVHTDKIYIFGGHNFKSYFSFDPYIID